MKKLWWSTLCILLLFACTTPEKKAKKILDEFSKELRVITDVENLSAYDLSNCIDKAYARLEENQKKARKELKKAEQKELFDEAFDINEVTIYFSLLEILTNKQLATLEDTKEKVWINAESKEASSMFMIDNKKLSFLHFKNEFAYELVNGKIIFKEKSNMSPIFFELKGDSLYIRNKKGEYKIYTEASINEAIQGTWNGVSELRFEKDGNGTETNIIWDGNLYKQEFTYKIDKNKITVNYLYNPSDVYNYVSPLKLIKTKTHGDVNVNYPYERHRKKGPEALNFLFDGNLKNTEAEKTQVSYTSSTTHEKTGVSEKKSGNNWDSVLDDYEEYFDQYVKLLKKAKNGDVSALTEYAKMLEKAQSIGNKLERAKGDLTANQSTRFLKIQQKLLNAASDL